MAMGHVYWHTLDELRATQERLEAAEEELAYYKAGDTSTSNTLDYTPLTP